MMNFEVRKTNGEVILVSDGTINTDTNLQLLGRGVEDYGLYVAQNLVRLLENFSSPYEPGTEDSPLEGDPVKGQLWYDSGNRVMKFYDGEKFISLMSDNITIGAADQLRYARRIELVGDVTGATSFDGSSDVEISTIVKRADVAGKLSQPIQFTLTGDIEGTVSIDGSGDVTMNTVLANDGTRYILRIYGDGNSILTVENTDGTRITADLSHTHTIDEITGLREELDSKLSASSVGGISSNTMSSTATIFGQIPVTYASSVGTRDIKIAELLVSGNPSSPRYLIIPSMRVQMTGDLQSSSSFISVYVDDNLDQEIEVPPNFDLDQSGNPINQRDAYSHHIKVDIPATNVTKKITVYLISKSGTLGTTIDMPNVVFHLVTPSPDIIASGYDSGTNNIPEIKIVNFNGSLDRLNNRTLRDAYNDQYGSTLNPDDDIRFIFNQGTIAGSSDSSIASVRTGTWSGLNTPIMIDNRALIIGKGGDAGGANLSSRSVTNPENGGIALELQTPIRLSNSGTISGGGGGGQSGVIYGDDPNYTIAVCGGGGAGYHSGQAILKTEAFLEAVPTGENVFEEITTIHQATDGTTSSNGLGGYIENYVFNIIQEAQAGDGGGYGESGGTASLDVSYTDKTVVLSTTSSGGAAIKTNGNQITYITQGNINGGVVN